MQKNIQKQCKKEYDLKKSKSIIGPLYPVLKSPNGEIIDGYHRKEADEKWPEITLYNIDSKLKLCIARLIANVQRRHVSAIEKSKLLADIAECIIEEYNIKSGNQIVEWISENTGFSRQWVYKYLPSRFKRKQRERSKIPKMQNVKVLHHRSLTKLKIEEKKLREFKNANIEIISRSAIKNLELFNKITKKYVINELIIASILPDEIRKAIEKGDKKTIVKLSEVKNTIQILLNNRDKKDKNTNPDLIVESVVKRLKRIDEDLAFQFLSSYNKLKKPEKNKIKAMLWAMSKMLGVIESLSYKLQKIENKNDSITEFAEKFREYCLKNYAIIEEQASDPKIREKVKLRLASISYTICTSYEALKKLDFETFKQFLDDYFFQLEQYIFAIKEDLSKYSS